MWPDMTRFTRRTVLRTAAVTVAAAIAATTTACAAPPPPKEVVQPAQNIETSSGLVIDGEQIADKELWDAAVAEGGITLYTGYTENTEAALLKQFTADTGIKVNVVRLTPNRLYERISAEYGAGKLKADVMTLEVGKTAATVRVTPNPGLTGPITFSIRATALKDGKYPAVSEAPVTVEITPAMSSRP